MRKNFIYLFVAAATLLAISCQKKEADTYQPAEPVSGAQYFFPSSVEKSYKLAENLTGIDITISRVEKDAASTAKIAVTDTSKTVFAEGLSTLSAAFAAGEKDSKITLPIDMTQYKYGDLYGIDLVITEETTPYGSASLHIEINYPEPWKSIGNATIMDRWLLNWIEDTDNLYPKGYSVEVPMEQNEVKPNNFRLLNPWGKLMASLDYSDASAEATQEYVNFVILKPGDNLGTDDDPLMITKEGLVYYNPICTGYYDSGNGGTHYYLHPCNFGSTYSEDGISHNYVQSWQEGENPLPAVVILSPFPYMYGVGGWNRSTAEEISIVFPGVVLKDYSVDVEYEGLLSSAKGDYALAAITLGDDLSEALVSIAPGDDPNDAFELILSEDESVISVTASGEVKLPLPEPAEAYTIVVAPLVDGEIVEKEAQFTTFAYKDFSISVTATDPVINADEVSGTVTASFVWGADVEYAKVALFEGTSKDLTPESLAIFDDEENEDVILVKHADDTIDIVLPQEGDYTLVAVSYALDEAWNVSVKDIEFVLVNPWETVGTATWTDAFFGPWFSASALSYDVELQANNEVPGFYRLVNVYGEAFAYNEEGDWDDSIDYFFKIHAEDAEHVWFETFDTGCDWGYGDFLLASDIGLFIEEYGLDTVIGAVDAGQIGNTFGVLSGNTITFPAKAVFKAMADYNNGTWYYGNADAEWSIVLNFDAAPSVAPKKVASRSLGSASKASRNRKVVTVASGSVSFASKALQSVDLR